MGMFLRFFTFPPHLKIGKGPRPLGFFPPKIFGEPPPNEKGKKTGFKHSTQKATKPPPSPKVFGKNEKFFLATGHPFQSKIGPPLWKKNLGFKKKLRFWGKFLGKKKPLFYVPPPTFFFLGPQRVGVKKGFWVPCLFFRWVGAKVFGVKKGLKKTRKTNENWGKNFFIQIKNQPAPITKKSQPPGSFFNPFVFWSFGLVGFLVGKTNTPPWKKGGNWKKKKKTFLIKRKKMGKRKSSKKIFCPPRKKRLPGKFGWGFRFSQNLGNLKAPPPPSPGTKNPFFKPVGQT